MSKKKRNFSYVGKWLFGFIVGYGFYSALGISNGKGKWIHLIRSAEGIREEWLFILEVIFNIAIYGIIPVIFFIIYSLTLSTGQREKLGLSLLIPKYILIPYGISLFLFIVIIIILPRLWEYMLILKEKHLTNFFVEGDKNGRTCR